MTQPTLIELSGHLAAGETTSRALIEESLKRIADPEGEGARAFLTVYAERARTEADAVDAARSKGEARLCLASPAFLCRSRTCSTSRASRPGPALERSLKRLRPLPTPKRLRSPAGPASSSWARPT